MAQQKENYIAFDSSSGHDHDGTDSKKVLGTNIDSTGGTSGQVLTADGSGGSSWAAAGGGGSAPANANHCLNGAFDFWQRGLTHTDWASGSYGPDQWKTFDAGHSGVYDIKASGTLPTVAQAGFAFNRSAHLDVTTADATLGATDFASWVQPFEGYNWSAFAFSEFTVSFWHRHTKTGTHSVAFQNNGADRTYVHPYTQTTTDTWEFESFTVPAAPSGTYGTQTTIGASLIFTIAAGSSKVTATTDSWISGASEFSASGVVNNLDSTSNNMFLTGIKIEAGDTATDFTRAGHSIENELALLQRYYEKTYIMNIAPGSASQNSFWQFHMYSNSIANNTGYSQVTYRTKKRTAPTVTLYSYGGNTNQISNNAGTDLGSNTWTINIGSDHGFNSKNTGGSISTSENRVIGHFVADASL